MSLIVRRNGYYNELGIEIPKKIMDSREKASGNGNDIRVYYQDRRVNVSMSNGTGDVDITATTTVKLIDALVDHPEGEFLILKILELKARNHGLTFSTRWSKLSEKDIGG